MGEVEKYLGEMEVSGLLPLLYNGWKLINDLPKVETVTLEIALDDSAFCEWIETNFDENIFLTTTKLIRYGNGSVHPLYP